MLCFVSIGNMYLQELHKIIHITAHYCKVNIINNRPQTTNYT